MQQPSMRESFTGKTSDIISFYALKLRYILLYYMLYYISDWFSYTV